MKYSDKKNSNLTFIIAELSANHNNDFELTKDTISAMKESGADAVKFQTYTADSLSIDCNNKYFQAKKTGLWKGQKPYQLYQKASMPWDWQPKLAEYAAKIGLTWLSSPFDFEAVDFLESIQCPAYKIASYEIVDIPLIQYTAKRGKPMIISTGIAEVGDIDLAIKTCKEVNNNDITILKCTSAYPTPFEDVNLSVIPNLKKLFNVKIGLSDHTMGFSVALGAVTLGASVIEKHFILNRKFGGVDSYFSMEPSEFKEMVKGIRELEKALGSGNYSLSVNAIDERKGRRSLFAVKDIYEGEAFNTENIKSVRPGVGLHPKYLNTIIGKRSKRKIDKGTPLSWELLLE